MKKIFGFTLAEVLITLGIIGVVAAIIIPTVINNTQNREYKAAYRKAYSAFGQAFTQALTNGDIINIPPTYNESGLASSSNMGPNFKAISNYFKTVKTCFDNNADECWVCDDGQAGAYYSSAPDFLGCGKYNYAFVDNSGMAWYQYSPSENRFLVDVNGDRKPNKLGKDRFVMLFTDSQDERFPDNITRIKPLHDIEDKGRWCPSGNCMYTKWLLE